MNRRPHLEAGLSLVELLIGMVLIGLVAAAVFSILDSTFRSRSLAEALDGRVARAILMKEALEHTVTNAGYIAYTTGPTSSLVSVGLPVACLLTGPVISPALPIVGPISSISVNWTVGSNGTCNPCSGIFTLSGNIASWTVSGGPVCGQGIANESTAVIPVGTGWTLSAVSGTSCLGPAFGTTAPAVVATNSDSQSPGSAPVEVSACLFNLQGQ